MDNNPGREWGGIVLLWISYKLLREEEEDAQVDASDDLVQAVKTIVLGLETTGKVLVVAAILFLGLRQRAANKQKS